MFNPYFARPIGSEQFERHLLTLMVRGDQEAKEAAEALKGYPFTLRVEEHNPARLDPVDEAWKLLGLAVYAMTIMDYLEQYACRLRSEDAGNLVQAEVFESRCLTLENEYFRGTEEGEWMIDSILREIIHNDRDHFYQQRICRIERTIRRIHRWIWTIQANERSTGRLQP